MRAAACPCDLVYRVIPFFITISSTIEQKSVQKLRQTYFKLKDQVFSNGKMGGFAYNSEELEKLLKEEFGTELKMSDIKHPK